MLQSYEKEQKVLTQEVADSRQTLEEAKQKTTDLRLLLRTLREMTEINELTPTLIILFCFYFWQIITSLQKLFNAK